MTQVISAESIIKVYRQPIRTPGVCGGLKDLFFRKYNHLSAVNGVSLSVNKGEFIGYIGPNGAGKSTSIKILTGILQATSGKLRVLGLDPFQERKKYVKQIGVVFGQRTQLWWDIAAIESFNLLAKIYEIPTQKYKNNLESLVELFNIKEILNTPVRKLSLGERMKCDIIASLLHDPAILFLDEPTIGLDAMAKVSIRETLKKLHSSGNTTIILTTHDLQEIEVLCRRIVVLDRGSIIYDGDIEKLKKYAGLSRQMLIELDYVPDGHELKKISVLKGVVNLNINSKLLIVDYDPSLLEIAGLFEIVNSKYRVNDLKIMEPGIESVIMTIYRKGFDHSGIQ